MRFFVISALLLVGGSAAAQVTTFTVGGDSSGTLAVSRDTLCGGSGPQIAYTIDSTYAAESCSGTALQVWADPSGSCGTQPDGGQPVLITVSNTDLVSSPSNTDSPYTVNPSKLVQINASGDFCSTAGAEYDETYAICLGLIIPGLNDLGTLSSCSTPSFVTNPTAISLRVDTTPPGAPGLTVSAYDAKATINIKSDGDFGGATIYYQFVRDGGGPAGEGVDPADGGTLDVTGWSSANCSSGSTTCQVTNLSNNVSYIFEAAALDEAGNQSPLSGSVVAKVEATSGFFSTYKSDGGKDGGCSTTASGLMGTAGVLALLGWLFGRRRG